MEMKKQKKIIGGMILVLAVTACASFFKSAAEEIAQEETSEIYQNEIRPFIPKRIKMKWKHRLKKKKAAEHTQRIIC